MIRLEVTFRTQPDDRQSGRDGALPGVRMDPSNHAWTCCQTKLDKCGAKAPIKLS